MPTRNMRRLTAAAVLLLAVQAGTLAQQQEADFVPPAKDIGGGFYPLVCMGGEIRVKLSTSTDGRAPNVQVTFRKGNTPSGARGENLEPGSCSWVDRGMHYGEPDRIFDDSLGTLPIEYEFDIDGTVRTQRVSSDYTGLRRRGVVYFLYVRRFNDPVSNIFEVARERGHPILIRIWAC